MAEDQSDPSNAGSTDESGSSVVQPDPQPSSPSRSRPEDSNDLYLTGDVESDNGTALASIHHGPSKRLDPAYEGQTTEGHREPPLFPETPDTASKPAGNSQSGAVVHKAPDDPLQGQRASPQPNPVDPTTSGSELRRVDPATLAPSNFGQHSPQFTAQPENASSNPAPASKPSSPGASSNSNSATTSENVYITLEDIPFVIYGFKTDENLVVTAVSAANGTVVLRPDGALDYAPDPDFSGTDTISYTVSDGQGGTDTATVTVIVNPVNDAPEAVDDGATTLVNTSVNISVLANDSDIEGDSLSVTSASSSNGSVSIAADGSLDYSPGTGFTGADTISYTVSDGNGGTDTATVSIQVTPLTGWSVSGTESVTEGGTATYTIALSETLAPGSSASVELVLSDIDTTVADYGDFASAVSSAIGSRTDLSFAGSTLTYTAPSPFIESYDAFGGGFVDISGTGSATGIGGNSNVNASIGFDFEFFGTTYTDLYIHDDGYITFGAGASGNASNGDIDAGTAFGGLPAIAPWWDALRPNPGDAYFSTSGTPGNQEFIVQWERFRHSNVGGGSSRNITFQLVLREGSNEIEFRYDDTTFRSSATAYNDGNSATIGLQDGAGTGMEFTQDGSPNTVTGGSTLTYTPQPAAMADLVIDLAIVDDPDAEGFEDFTIGLSNSINSSITANDSVTTRILDNDGIPPGNDPPSALDDTDTTNEGSSEAGNVISNDSDPDGDALVVSAVQGSATNVGTQVALASGATITVQSDGSYIYDPNGQFEHLNDGDTATDSFSYTLSDIYGQTDTATVVMTVEGVSDAPTVGTVDLGSIPEDGSVTFSAAQLLENTTDPDSSSGDLDIVSVSLSSAFGALSDNADGTWTFTPLAHLHGSNISFSITAADEGGRTATGLATVDIDAVADAVTSLAINADTGHYFTQVAFMDAESAPLADTDSDGFVAGTFEGWAADSPRQIEVRNFETSTAGGNWHLEVDDDPANAYPDAGEIYQEFETSAGANYTVSFDWSPRPTYSAAVNTVEIVWGGQVVATLSKDGTALSGPDWESYTINVIGTGSVERLTIREPDTAELDNGRGIFVDNIAMMTDGDAQASGQENTAISITGIEVEFGPDTDNSEQHILSLGNIPVGAIVQDENDNSFTATTVDTSVDLFDSLGPTAANWDLASLTVTPPVGFVGNFDLHVIASATEQSNGDTASATETLTVHVYTAGSVHGDDTANVINGTSGADQIIGEGGDDTLSGGDWHDYIAGESGNDTIDGDAGYDRLFGGSGDDTIDGGTEDDILFGGLGDDDLDGGAGDDIAAFNLDAFAVDANLVTGIATGQGTDTLTNIEDLTGSAFDDTLTGDSNANVLRGEAGDDTIDGGAGDDILSGGDGDDLFLIAGDGSDGTDTVEGGTGSAWIDTIELDTPGVYGTAWTISMTSGSITSTGGNFVQFSDDAAGTIDLGNDSTVDISFTDLERIEW